MKLNNDTGNPGLDSLLTLCGPRDMPDYGAEEVTTYLVFMDNLDVIVAEDMLISGDYDE